MKFCALQFLTTLTSVNWQANKFTTDSLTAPMSLRVELLQSSRVAGYGSQVSPGWPHWPSGELRQLANQFPKFVACILHRISGKVE